MIGTITGFRIGDIIDCACALGDDIQLLYQLKARLTTERVVLVINICIPSSLLIEAKQLSQRA